MSNKRIVLVLAVVATLSTLFLWRPWESSNGTPDRLTGQSGAPDLELAGKSHRGPEQESRAGDAKDAERQAATRQAADLHTTVRGRFAPVAGVLLQSAVVDLVPAPELPEGGAMGMLSLGTEIARLQRKARASGKKDGESLVERRLASLTGRLPAILTTGIDRTGGFVFENPPAGDFVARLRHPLARSVDERVFTIRRGNHLDLGLLRADSAGSLVVIVTDATGRAVTNAHVELRREVDMTRFMNPQALGNPMHLMQRLIPFEKKTDEQGIARFESLPTNEPWFLATSASRLVEVRRSVRVLRARENLVRIELRPGKALDVSVITPEGQPVSGTRVSVTFPDLPAPNVMKGLPTRQAGSWSKRGRTDARGRVRIAGLPAGRAVVTSTPTGYRTATKTLTLAADLVASVELRLERGMTLAGRVIDEAGQPIPKARVLASQFGQGKIMGTDMSEFLGDVVTLEIERSGIAVDERGEFLIGGFAKGETVELLAAAPGFDRGRSGRVVAGSTAVDITLKEAATLRGVVVSASDSVPVRDFTVKLTKRAFLVMSREVLRRDFSDRENGEFVLGDAPRARFEISVQAKGYASFATSADLRDGTSVDLGEIRLTRPASIAGVTLGPIGQPIAGVAVRVAKGGAADSMMMANMTGQRIVKSDAGGRFRLENLTGRRVRLLADLDGYAPLRSKVIRLTPGETTTNIELQLAKGGSIKGVLVDAEDRPLAGWHAQAAHTSGRGLRFAQTKRDGGFEFAGLAPGTYKVDCIARSAMMGGGFVANRGRRQSFDFGAVVKKIASQTVSARVVIRKDEQAEVRLVYEARTDVAADAFTRVTGHVSLAGRSLESGTLFLLSTGASEQNLITEIEDGHFELRQVRAGHYRVRIQRELLGSPIGQQRVVRVPKAATHRIQIDLPAGAIGGRVTVAGRPAAGVAVSLLRRGRSGGSERMSIGEGTALSGSDGEFRFEGLDPGTYALIAKELATPRGYARSARVGDVRLASGQCREDLVLALGEGADLAVLVTSERGPTPNALVTLLGPHGQPIDLFHRSLTDRDGRITFENLPDGTYRACVDAPAHAPKLSLPIVLSGAKQRVAIALERGVATHLTLHGEIPPEARGELALFSLWRDGAFVKAGRFTIPRGEDAGQRIPLGRLAAGRYRLRVETTSRGVFHTEQEVAASKPANWSVKMR